MSDLIEIGICFFRLAQTIELFRTSYICLKSGDCTSAHVQKRRKSQHFFLDGSLKK